jgi:hypothetical protein
MVGEEQRVSLLRDPLSADDPSLVEDEEERDAENDHRQVGERVARERPQEVEEPASMIGSVRPTHAATVLLYIYIRL